MASVDAAAAGHAAAALVEAAAAARRLVNRAPVGPAWLHDKLAGECVEAVFTPGRGKVQSELSACLYSHLGTRELVRPSPAQWIDGVFAGWALAPDAAGTGQVYATMLYDRGTPCQLENGTMAERRGALTFACGADGPVDAAAVMLTAGYPGSRCELRATVGVREFCDFPYDVLMAVGVMEGSALPSPSHTGTPRPTPTAGAAFDAAGGGIIGAGPLTAAGLTPATAALVGAGVPAVLTLLALAAIYALYRRHVARMTAQYLDGKLNGPYAAAVAAQGAHYVNKLRAAGAGGGASVTNPLAFAMTPAARALTAQAAAAGRAWVPELPGGASGVANPLADLFTLQQANAQQPWGAASGGAAQRRRASSASVASGSGGSVVVSVGGGRTQAATVRAASSVASASSTSASSGSGVPNPFAAATMAAMQAQPPAGGRAPKLPPPLTSVTSGARGAVKVPVPPKPTAALALQPQPPKARTRPASLAVAGGGARASNPFAAAAAALQLPSSRRASTSSDGAAGGSVASSTAAGSVVGSASVSTAEMARGLEFYSPLRRAVLPPHGGTPATTARSGSDALASPASTSPRSPYAPVVNENLVHSLAVRGSLPAVPAWRRRMSESSAGAGSVASSSTTDGGSSLAPALSVASSGNSSVLTANALAAYRSATVAAAVSHDRQHHHQHAARPRTNSGAVAAAAPAISSPGPARAIRVATTGGGSVPSPAHAAASPAAPLDGAAATVSAIVESRMPRALSVSAADAAAAAPPPAVDPAVAAVGVAVRGNPLAAFGNLTSGQRKRALTASSDTSTLSSGGGGGGAAAARRAINVQTVATAALPDVAAAPAAAPPSPPPAPPVHERASSQGPAAVMVPSAPMGGRLPSRGARYRDGSPAADGDRAAAAADRALLRPQQAGRRNASPAVRPSGGAALRVGVTTLRGASQDPEGGANDV